MSAKKSATINAIPSTTIVPEHDEEYESESGDDTPKPVLEKRLSMVEDKRLRSALAVVRRGSQKELKEECLRAEWYGGSSISDKDKEMLKDCVIDEDFWAEVKELARIELETVPEVMNDEKFRAMFRQYDEDGSGAIEAPELQKLLVEAMGMEADMEEVIDLMKTVDVDGNGEIDENEFLDIMNLAKRHQEESGEQNPIRYVEVEGGCLAQARLEQSAEEWKKRQERKAALQAEMNIAAESMQIAVTPPTAGGSDAPGSPPPKAGAAGTSGGCGAAPGAVKTRSMQLYDEARRTDDPEKKKKILADAAVEEYKEMLKQKALNARLKEERKIDKEKEMQKKIRKAAGSSSPTTSPGPGSPPPPVVSVEPPPQPAKAKTGGTSLGSMTKKTTHADPNAGGKSSSSMKKAPGKSLGSLTAKTKKAA